MMIFNNFSFTTNISVEAYTTKKEATACLSREGAMAVGKNKMAFKEHTVTISEFIAYATTGHAFCNLFNFNPDQKYWMETSTGQHFLSYPVYKNGENKGAMKVSFKSDIFFKGSQTVFVDIDKTRFLNVADYISTLTLPPTCVYMSFSDNKDKGGMVSRRFRLVYVLDHIVGRDELTKISRAINDMIRIDTDEEIEDDCGTRISQYMNGVYGNSETYETDYIYSVSDFDRFVFENNYTETPTMQDDEAPDIVFNVKMLEDMGSYDPAKFMHYYSTQYKYLYRTEKPEWVDGMYQTTDEDYMQLWFYREKQVDGQHRRRKLFKNACMRRLMFPDIDPDTLLFNLYVDFIRFFDNSDHVIQLETLVKKVKTAMKMTREELEDYCSFEIWFWKKNRPKFILYRGFKATQGLLGHISKDIRWREIDAQYDRSKSVKENAALLDIPRSTLYRFCAENDIDTNPNKGITKEEKRANKRMAKQDKIKLFKELYNPELTLKENRDNLLQEGMNIVLSTISVWASKYYEAPEDDEVPAVDFSMFLPRMEAWNFTNYVYA